MNMKKIAILSLSLCMIAAIAVTGTIAYFTDVDSETNEFTIGNVDIELVEDFPENELHPGEENALEKAVTVKNVGTEDAYMWIELWIPSALDAGEDNAADNSLHFNPFDTYVDEDGNEHVMRGSEAKKLGYTLKYETVETYLGKKMIGEVEYTGYRQHIKNDTAKAKDASTATLLARVFMDKDVAQCTTDGHEDNCLVLKNGTTHYTGDWEIIVNAYGIQANGIENIDAAIAAYDGEVR